MSCRRSAEIDLAAFAADRHAPEWRGFRAHYPVCPDCSRAVAAWAQLHSVLEASVAEESAHVAEDELLAVAADPVRLPEARRRAVEAHLAGCAPCRSELAVLRGFDFAALGAPAARRFAAEEPPGWIDRLAAALIPLRRPAFALAVAVLVAIPAGIAMWRLWQGAASPGAPPPIAQEEPVVTPPAPGPGAEPGARELAREPAPAAPPAPEPAPAPVVAERASPERAGGARIAETPPAPRLPAPDLAPPAPEAVDLAALLPEQPPHYRERFTVAAAPLATGTAIRGSIGDLPALRPLAPDRGGATLSPTPTLYWYLSEPSAVPVELTLIAEDAVEPLLELRFEAPVAAGLHALPLDGRGVALSAGATYAWYATLVPDAQHRDLDFVSGTAIRYEPATADLERRLEEAGAARRAHVLAEQGYWIDAFAALTRIAQDHPESTRARAQQVALLEQAGLGTVAAGLTAPTH